MLATHAPAIVLVILFILIHFWPSTLIRYVCIFFLIHCHQHFQIDAFLMITLSILFSVDRRHKCIEMWKGPKFQTPLFQFLRGKPCPCQHFTIAFVLVLMAVTVSTHLCAICHHFICLVLPFQGRVAHQISPQQGLQSAIKFVETLCPKRAFWHFKAFPPPSPPCNVVRYQ